ncbi:hypothetical protein AVT25_gp09 [Bacillus phage Pavlov]|uniref:Uncharacterized protein n=1 Tax=Bacillus phage Pony TaxID=1406789 RepID=U5PW70_9CAUD|nr:hypothetical protein Pony_9 [Bacillus phage Pony]YP_009197478.1 hypothetical protein AVT25_gp09 [Bacillus phage Pavlov]AGY48250.1 hypothetical protein Pony_9 [Bacillus phage Pony]AKQ07430.1 hypothetical protein CPT_Pavlov9 [Bacillus phage Pavlov]
MATFIETMPKHDDEMLGEVFNMSPIGEANGEFIDGYMRTAFFTAHYESIANATASPLTQTNYEALKAINKYWKINAINWRKNGVFPVYNIPADKLIDEEEAFLLEMYPPPAEEEQPTTEENTTEGA